MRVLFANSGIMGHRTVHRLIGELAPSLPDIEATTLDLSSSLTTFDRILRRLLCVHPISTNHDLARWRMEWFTGLHMRHALRRLESVDGRFDQLHLHPQALGYALLQRMTTTPTVISIDCTQHLAMVEAAGRALWSFRPSFWQDNRVFTKAGSIVSVSRWAKGLLGSLSPDFADKTITAPYPIDVSRFPQDWVVERLHRSKSPGYKPVVLFIGGDFQRKGGETLLNVWSSKEFAKRAELRVVTSPAHLPSPLPKGVVAVTGVTPYSPEWFRCWREADLFVFPTRAEAFGMVLQEAAAAGLPTVATQVCAVPELVLDGRTGILTELDHPAALGDAIQSLLDAPTQRASMGRAARTYIEQLCSVEVYRQRLTEALASARSRSRGL